MNQRDRFRGSLLGLAVGDAVGTAVEFRSRGSFRPVTDMTGGGPFSLSPGQWTDDTSMALCLATSLLERGTFDAHDQMDRYCRWLQSGYLSSTGTCFDIGRTVASALRRFQETREPFAGSDDPRSAGNGSIMRLAPIPMFYFPDLDAAERYSAESSRTTHAAAECIDACRLFGRIICRALLGKSRDEVALGDSTSFSGAEAAILSAVNLGDDADTTAAVCGQLAGAYYGVVQIPASWLDRLVLSSEITRLADELSVSCGTPGLAS